MKPKVIKTGRDHRQALARIEKLMDARPGTPQADELELLAALVEIYEDKAFPIDEPDPLHRQPEQSRVRRDATTLYSRSQFRKSSLAIAASAFK